MSTPPVNAQLTDHLIVPSVTDDRFRHDLIREPFGVPEVDRTAPEVLWFYHGYRKTR
jgi:hypothetical protein